MGDESNSVVLAIKAVSAEMLAQFGAYSNFSNEEEEELRKHIKTLEKHAEDIINGVVRCV